MAARPIIAVDIDDVLADHAAGFVEFSNKRWDTHLTVDDYDEHWAHMWQIDNDETEIRAKEFHESGTVGGYDHKSHALPVLDALSERFKLIIITSRRAQVEKETRAWLAERYPGIFSEVHFSGIWDTIEEGTHLATKADVCRSLGVDYLIDDQVKHCVAAAECGTKSLLFGDYAWNRTAELADGVTRVKDWNMVKRYFEGR